MTEISFYVSKSATLKDRLLLACRLTQKAYDKGWHVHIHTDSQATSQRLDELLWTWHPSSFLPHALAENTGQERIIIGHNYEPTDNCDYLINLSNTKPEFFSRFVRMGEIIDQSQDLLTDGRKRYAYYRERGYTLKYHQL
jgi:DNA polymerase-3 subunit chi